MLFTSAEFVPSGAREWLNAPILRLALMLALRPALSPALAFTWQRRWIRQLARWTRPNTGVGIEAGVVGGTAGEWVRPPGGPLPARSTILYLHGGGYCIGSAMTHRAVTSHLARAAERAVFAADYRLAPEHPFPAAIEDSVSAYRSLAELGPVVIAGDSTGGGLALATAMVLRQRRIKPPASLVLFSPLVDLAMSAHSQPPRKRDAMLNAGWLAACARHYLAGTDAAEALASPIHGDLRGLPPTLIQVGADELLRSDGVRLHHALESAGVAVRCEDVPRRWHVFQLHAGMLPSADAAIGRAADFIARANQNIG
jgi:acetyl esterase/lipase